MKEIKLWHSIGVRDMLSSLFMQIRDEQNIKKVLLNLANQISENPHANWFKNNIDKL